MNNRVQYGDCVVHRSPAKAEGGGSNGSPKRQSKVPPKGGHPSPTGVTKKKGTPRKKAAAKSSPPPQQAVVQAEGDAPLAQRLAIRLQQQQHVALGCDERLDASQPAKEVIVLDSGSNDDWCALRVENQAPHNAARSKRTRCGVG